MDKGASSSCWSRLRSEVPGVQLRHPWFLGNFGWLDAPITSFDTVSRVPRALPDDHFTTSLKSVTFAMMYNESKDALEGGTNFIEEMAEDVY